MQVIAVTGTDGKTSTVSYTRQLLRAGGLQASSYGSDGWHTREGHAARPPGFVGLHALPDLLAIERANGADAIVVEAFSSSLAAGIYDQVAVDAAAFTNLGHDHLDRHGDRTRYLGAKRRLFEHVLCARGTAVLDRSTSPWHQLANVVNRRGGRVLTVGLSAAASIRLHQQLPHPAGTWLDLQIGRHRTALVTPVLGGAVIHDVLLAIGLALDAGIPSGALFAALPNLTPPAGRLESIGQLRGATVMLDTAHTPDALAAALNALRPRCRRRLCVVFGCGGNRDASKRPLMARVAAELADVVTITDDNPRSEDPEAIRTTLLAECPEAMEIPDRTEAIVHAIERLQSGDVLLVAGRGDESHQQRADGACPLSDRAVVQAALLASPAQPDPACARASARCLPPRMRTIRSFQTHSGVSRSCELLP